MGAHVGVKKFLFSKVCIVLCCIKFNVQKWQPPSVLSKESIKYSMSDSTHGYNQGVSYLTARNFR